MKLSFFIVLFIKMWHEHLLNKNYPKVLRDRIDKGMREDGLRVTIGTHSTGN